ncbi:protein of unknown function [Actinacidiphila rubida]|uniref:DUF4349 domain-containing protein n=2 Tax=Actinacidiphila rubida TaxID=310780 RepID=A0A1H8FSN0_9ACTN|nr:DUF4349 domain-containing protein [Actinacidiphila rubida]SEN34544.1 protein of unknown function [Actinacidiphila rubida]
MEANDTARTAARQWRRRRRTAAACGLLLAAAVALAGCGSSGGSRSNDSAAAPQARNQQDTGNADAAGTGGTGGAGGGTAGTGGAGTTAPRPAPGSLIRVAHLTVRTPHVEQQLDAARTMAADAGGYAGDEQTTVDARGHAESTVELRVPVAAYDATVTRLAKLGTLLARTVSVQDVTGQVVDVASRVRSQQASVARVRALMDRASSLSDVVSLESELSTRESALEALEAQQAALRSQTELATISLRLTEPPARPAPPHPARKHDGFWTVVGHGLGQGWHAFYVTMRVLLVVAAVVLPFALLALLVWYGYRLLRRRLPGIVPGHRPEPSTLRAPDGSGPRVPGPALPAYPGAARKAAPKASGAPDRPNAPEGQDEPEGPPAG